jgi:uncharacterized membrane protein YraQ (UPF0718 family)
MITTTMLAGLADRVSNFTTIFLSLFIEAMPFLLLGTLGSGLVEAFVNQDDLNRWIPRDPIRGALVGALIGLCIPVCECGVVPLTRRLLRKGLPLSVGVTLLLAAPVLNPIVIASTVAAFGFGRILLFRLGLSLMIAMTTGLLFSLEKRPEHLLQPAAWAPIAGGSGLAREPDASLFKRPRLRAGLRVAARVTREEFFEMGRYLIVGGVLAALMQTFVPQSALLTVSAGPVMSVVTLMLLAVVLSVCSTVDAFIALAFASSFTTGSVLAFLVFGPMVDIKSTLMFLTVLRRRAVVYLILLPLMMTLVATVFLNLHAGW